jgi:hypothetical protein
MSFSVYIHGSVPVYSSVSSQTALSPSLQCKDRRLIRGTGVSAALVLSAVRQESAAAFGRTLAPQPRKCITGHGFHLYDRAIQSADQTRQDRKAKWIGIDCRERKQGTTFNSELMRGRQDTYQTESPPACRAMRPAQWIRIV